MCPTVDVHFRSVCVHTILARLGANVLPLFRWLALFGFRGPGACDKRPIQSFSVYPVMCRAPDQYKRHGFIVFVCSVLCRAIEFQNTLEAARSSQLFRTNPQRYLALSFVKAFPIDAASPFNIGEHPAVRDFLSLMRKNFDVSALNNKAVSQSDISVGGVGVRSVSFLLQITAR